MPAGIVTGDSNNVTIGGAQVLFDAYDIGYTDGDIEAACEKTVKELEDGIPLQVVLQVPIREKWNIKIPMVESTMENIARASSNLVVSTSNGSEVTIGTRQNFTFADSVSGPLQTVKLTNSLAGSIRTPNVNTVVVSDPDGSPVYVVNDDYFIDAERGVIHRNPTGDIPEDHEVGVTWKYVPAAYEKIPFGVNTPIINKKVEFIHRSPVDGSIHHTVFWKCQGSGNLQFGHQKEEWAKFDAELVALPDPINHPTEPTGFRLRVPAAGAAAYLATIDINE